MEMNQIKVPHTVVSRAMGAEDVLLHLESGQYFGLNPVGAEIWRQLLAGQSASLEALTQHVAATFAIDPLDARVDVQDFLESLAAAHLIEISPKDQGNAPQAVTNN